MLCEFAYYHEDDPIRPRCRIHTDEVFGDKCPLIYLCKITCKYENTADAMECVYRKEEFNESN